MLVTMSVSPGLTRAHPPAVVSSSAGAWSSTTIPVSQHDRVQATHAVRAAGAGWPIPRANLLHAVPVPGARRLGRGLVTRGSRT
jgi:hypothetical protein